jgi:hypothetical protein
LWKCCLLPRSVPVPAARRRCQGICQILVLQDSKCLLYILLAKTGQGWRR